MAKKGITEDKLNRNSDSLSDERFPLKRTIKVADLSCLVVKKYQGMIMNG